MFGFVIIYFLSCNWIKIALKNKVNKLIGICDIIHGFSGLS